MAFYTLSALWLGYGSILYTIYWGIFVGFLNGKNLLCAFFQSSSTIYTVTNTCIVTLPGIR